MPARFLRWARTVVLVLIFAICVGSILKRTATALNHNSKPAGFARGVLHGALMPLALPNLVVGNDVPIYAEHNTGVNYKLGYTLGVNVCGAIFFGLFYWRLNRMRRSGPEKLGRGFHIE